MSISLIRKGRLNSRSFCLYCNNSSFLFRQKFLLYRVFIQIMFIFVFYPYCIMNDKQQLLIDCISLLPVIGILVLITVANDQLVTMVAAYVLCGELLCVLVSRILNLYYIDVAFVWLGGIMLWLWYWLWLESSHVVMEIVERTVE